MPGAGSATAMKHNYSAVVFGILSLLLLCFMWGQSMMPRDVSASESRALMEFIKPIFDPSDQLEEEVFHHFLRKTGHFCEYTAFAFCMSGFFRNLKGKRKLHFSVCAFLSSVAAAAVDETIQIFSLDRGPQFSDVLLDSCGALCGLLIFLLLAHVWLSICKTAKNSRVSE